MVSLNVNAEAKAKVQGSEEGDRYPIVTEVKGAGEDGSLKVAIDGGSPISARVGGDADKPIALDLPGLLKIAESVADMAGGIKVKIASDESSTYKVALGRIPVDLTVSVTSPKEESVLTVNIKGSVGD